MTMDEFLETQSALQGLCDAAARRLHQWDSCRHGNGLTPDSVKCLPEWQAAKAEWRKAFEALRKFNGRYCPQFKQEMTARMEARRIGEARQ